jgi:hypothetical protein
MKFGIILIALIYFNCAGTKEVVKEEAVVQNTPQFDESFDPLSLNDDDIIIAGVALPEPVSSENNSNLSSVISAPKEITGYRVQILATKDIETASLFEQEASERFFNQDHKTYLIFKAPLYRIRVGDCKDRVDAEKIRDLAIEYGYREAFIVKSLIQVME